MDKNINNDSLGRTILIRIIHMSVVLFQSLYRWIKDIIYPLSPLLKCQSISTRKQEKILKECGLFDASYYLRKNKDVAQSGMDPLIHFVHHGWKEYRCPSQNFSSRFYLSSYPEVVNVNPLLHFVIVGSKEGHLTQMTVAEKIRLRLRKSDFFDIDYYREQAKAYDLSEIRPIDHFLKVGWKAGLSSSPRFDPVDYLRKVPGLGKDKNPVLHYLEQGPQKGIRADNELGDHKLFRLSSQKGRNAFEKKRICLFAGYDSDGMVDPYVLYYLKQLSKYADIFYLADSSMDEKELKKLQPYTKKAWAIEHRLYDFGSYAMLAEELVGWKTIEGYEELIFANDSCYCIDSFEHLFDKMDQSNADFWGIQSTIHPSYREIYYALRHCEPQKILWHEIKESDFHIGSYFIAVRNSCGAFFHVKKMLANVEECTTKSQIILRYEIGMTQGLLKEGYKMDSFIEEIYPFHPVYSLNAFRILAQGSPLLKIGILKTDKLENDFYSIPLLYRWQAFLNIRSPKFDHCLIIDHLKRVTEMGDGFPDQPPREYCFTHDMIEDMGGISFPWQDIWKSLEKKAPLTSQRVCLFAGHNPEGLITHEVRTYIEGLAEYSDVYYLSDTLMQKGELEILAGCTKGAWSLSHKKNDFGSYSELAKHFVGWPRLKNYDELLLVNDSCYFIDSLENVFVNMEKKRGTGSDFGGLQGKLPHAYSEENTEDEGYIQPHFFTFNHTIIQDYQFQSFLDNIVARPSKKAVTRNYEIGVFKNLMAWGYSPWFLTEEMLVEKDTI